MTFTALVAVSVAQLVFAILLSVFIFVHRRQAERRARAEAERIAAAVDEARDERDRLRDELQATRRPGETNAARLAELEHELEAARAEERRLRNAVEGHQTRRHAVIRADRDARAVDSARERSQQDQAGQRGEARQRGGLD